jgi:proline racemase
LIVETVDYHTAGEPFRIVTGGAGPLAGATILDKRRDALARFDEIRKLLVFEPRGHADMYGCFVCEPNDGDADLGVVFFHNAGYSTACGHGTIALVTWALDEGVIPRADGEQRVVVDVPSGRLETWATIEDGRVRAVRFRNVPAYVWGTGLRAANRDVDVAFGGAFYASCEETVAPEELPRLIELGRGIKRDLETAHEIVHPLEHELRDVYGVIFWQDAQRHRVRRRRGRPVAVRERHLRQAGAPRRCGRPCSRGRAAPPLDHRYRVQRTCLRRGDGGGASGRRHRGGGERLPHGAPRLRARRRRPARDGVSPALAQLRENLVGLGKAPDCLLREDQPVVGDDVELAVLSRHRGGFMPAVRVDRGRETRGPSVVAASDGAVEDLDVHLPERTQMSSTPSVRCSLASPSGSAILPSATIGLFQWPAPAASLAIGRDDDGRYTLRPPLGS